MLCTNIVFPSDRTMFYDNILFHVLLIVITLANVHYLLLWNTSSWIVLNFWGCEKMVIFRKQFNMCVTPLVHLWFLVYHITRKHYTCSLRCVYTLPYLSLTLNSTRVYGSSCYFLFVFNLYILSLMHGTYP